MRVVDLDQDVLTLDEILSASAEEDVVLTKGGHVRARIERFGDDDWADWLFEHDPKSIQAADAARERRKFGQGTPLATLRDELGA